MKKKSTVDRLAAKHAKERHLGILERALMTGRGYTAHNALPQAEVEYAGVRSLLKAITPGLQKTANIADLMDRAVKARARFLRRS